MVIFITGPSGSGKSTTAEMVASKWENKCALLQFDKIRTFIKSGYAEPARGWTEETKKQWDIAKQVLAEMSKAYNANNVDVVIEAFATPGEDYQSWKNLFKDHKLKTVVLLPTRESVITRNNQRVGIEKLKEEDINQNYDWSEVWRDVPEAIIIDNTNLTPEETVEYIIKML